MTRRAPTNSTTGTGSSPTGAQMTYDTERRLASWQNAPSAPTSSTSNLYDGEGNRVAQTVTNGAATTTVTYIGDLEELSTTAGVTTTTTSYYAGGKRIAQAVNGAFSYLGSDGLGSAEVALDGSGTVQASVLYDPYGNPRYSSGTMPGSYGYTGQHADAATGLDDYHARYYDPVAGQFASADAVQDGLNRYAYVGGDPETFSDPTGHARDCQQFDDCGGGGGTSEGSGPPSSSGCGDTCGCDKSCRQQPSPPPSGCTSHCGGCKVNCGAHGGGSGGSAGQNGSSTQLSALIESACGPLGGLCGWIMSRLSSMSVHDLGNWLRWIGYGLVLAGIAVLVVDLIYTLKTGVVRGLGRAFETVARILNLIGIAVGFLSNAPGVVQSMALFIAGLVEAVSGILDTAAGIFNTLGWFGQAAATAGVVAATNAADPEVAPIEDAAGAVIGAGVSFLLNGVGSLLISVGAEFIALGYYEQGN
ncbi:MAG TPA: RHS repeat-associated core domain-containing protein [Ktedonobacterales bacterium]